MTSAKRLRLFLDTARTYGVIRESLSNDSATVEQLAFAERCLEQAALIWAAGLTDDDKRRIGGLQ